MDEGVSDGDPLLLFPSEQADPISIGGAHVAPSASSIPSQRRPDHLATSSGESCLNVSQPALVTQCPQAPREWLNTPLRRRVWDRVRAAGALVTRGIVAPTIAAASASATAVQLAGRRGAYLCRSWVMTGRAWATALLVTTSRFRRSVLVFDASTFLCGLAVGALFMGLMLAPFEQPHTSPDESAVAASGIIADRPSRNRTTRVSTLTLQVVPPVAVVDALSSISAPAQTAATPTERTAAGRATPVQTPFRGSLTVLSQPEGAQVYVNGREVGTTPVTMQHEPAGSRVVRVTLNDYDVWSASVRVVADEQNVVTANLRRAR